MLKGVLRLYWNSSNKRKVNYLKRKGCIIGKNVSILCGVDSFSTEPYLIRIGSNVRITMGVMFLTHDGGSLVASVLKNKPFDKFGIIKIGDNVFIGINSIILPGVSIGSNVIIGAGAVVTKNVEDNCVVAGIPARYICSISEYIDKNESKFELTRGLNSRQKREILEKKYQ